jgi:phosphohistidine phosphatase
VVADEIGFPWEDVQIDGRVYMADSFELLEVIQELDDELECVMMFGHNPGMTELVDYLAPNSIGNMPTCGVVEMVFNIESWESVSEVEVVHFDFDYPKRIL